MGQYFSLRGGQEWGETLEKTEPPSIWSTATYTPLAKSQQILLARPGRVEFFFPGTFKQGGDYVHVSEVCEVQLLVAYDAETGRCYSGLCLQAHPNFPHKFSRTVEEVKVGRKAAQKEPGVEDISQSEVGSPTAKMMKSSSRLSIEKLGEPEEAPANREHDWSCCLLYAVKEGILVYFADDLESCEQVVRRVQSRYREVQDLAASMKASEAPLHPKAETCRHLVGGAPPVAGRILSRILQEDLQRRFQVTATVEEQKDSTNCVIFCMRVIKGFQMCLRGFDIVKAGEANPSIGRRAGDIAGDVWERLWHRI